jgi:hypothetical protein
MIAPSSFAATLACVYCLKYYPSTRQARVLHEKRHHQAAFCANLEFGHERYIPAAIGTLYCRVCGIYIDIEVEHDSTEFHISNMEIVPRIPTLAARAPQTELLVNGAQGKGHFPKSGSAHDNVDWPEYNNEEYDDSGASGVEPPYADTGNSDWLKPRQDEIDFASHKLVGEVFLLPVNHDDWREGDHGTASQDFRNYARYRIVDIETSKVQTKKLVCYDHLLNTLIC